MKLVIASNNQNKVREIKEILGNFFDEVLSLREANVEIEIEETGKTFEENSMIKAKAVWDILHMPVLADDSGLCVECLNGEPGVYSARYAGNECNDENNIDKLLEVMKNQENRNAEFVTVATLILSSGIHLQAKGTTKGEICKKRIGTAGFGYDPVFYSFELEKTFGEASENEKNAVSHRSKAILSLQEKLESLF